MSNILARWFGFGLGAAAGRALYDEGSPKPTGPEAASPTGARTEAEFKRDEKIFAEDEKRLERKSRD